MFIIKVFSSRSSPEIGCLIPYITSDLVCLFYVSLPFDDDIRRFTLDNFDDIKKFQPTEKQSRLVDELIDTMDLSKKSDDDEAEELYDPHLTFNPYIQRMFQTIAMRATDPSSELPDFGKHITSAYLSRLGAAVSGSERAQDVLKRMSDAFPLRSFEKLKPDDESATRGGNIFEKKKSVSDGDDKENNGIKSDLNGTDGLGLNELLNSSGALNKIRNIGKDKCFLSKGNNFNRRNF